MWKSDNVCQGTGPQEDTHTHGGVGGGMGCGSVCVCGGELGGGGAVDELGT